MSKVNPKLVLLVSCIFSTAMADQKVDKWHLDNESVSVGGPVTIIIDYPARDAARLTLSLNGQQPIRLTSVADAREADGRTAMLLAYNIHFPEISQSADDTVNVIRIPPIFENAGEVNLTLESDGESWGTKTVTVVPVPPGAHEANDLLYPKLVRDREPKLAQDRGGPDPASLTWMHLIIKDSFGLTPPVTDGQMQQLRDQLPIIMKHPDWAEIAEMLVARLEARHHRDAVTVERNGTRTIKDDFIELPALPDVVARSLRARPTNPYVQAIQDNMRGFVTDLRLMDAQRRGEDIQEILKADSIKK